MVILILLAGTRVKHTGVLAIDLGSSLIVGILTFILSLHCSWILTMQNLWTLQYISVHNGKHMEHTYTENYLINHRTSSKRTFRVSLPTKKNLQCSLKKSLHVLHCIICS